MIVKKIRAVDFRNIESCEVSFSDGANLLLGNNAEGKTNLLEAVYYFARGKSFRGATDRELCRFGTGGYLIELEFFGGGRDQTLSYRFYEGSKLKKRNGAVMEKASEMLGHFRAVLFYPEHLQLVKGSPALRREFLNIAISQIEPSYIPLYASYQRILDNRNALLKAAQKGGYFEDEEYRVWSVRLAEAAADIALMRYRYVDKIKGEAKSILYEMSGEREDLSVSYLSEAPFGEKKEIKEFYERLFLSDTRREIAAGFTVFGPHHDDLSLIINERSAREFASQGQQRSISLALKLSEGEVCKRECGEYPVFLFDDVMSELDPERRNFILSKLEKRQLILTACEDGGFRENGSRIIKTEGGRYEDTDQQGNP